MLRNTVAIASLLASSVAVADPDPERTKAAMNEYFAGEKSGGTTLVAMGIGGIAAGTVLYLSPHLVDGVDLGAAGRAMSYPLLGVGVLHIAAGLFIRASSNKRIDTFTAQIDADPAAFVVEEQQRMKGVSRQFSVLKIVEVVLIAGGLAATGVGIATDRPRLAGVGLGVAVEMGATLAFDFAAASRAHRYRSDLAGLDVQTARDPSTGATVILLGHARTF